jgi:hypothetical protein
MSIDPEFVKKHDLNYEELHAYQMCLLWEEFSKKFFPGVRLEKLPKRGNIKKNILFRNCYKMIKDLSPTMRPYEISLFMKAQFESFVGYNEDLGFNCCISVNSLHGPKSLYRYKKWLATYQRRKISNVIKKATTNISVVEKEFLKTLYFLESWNKDFKIFEKYKENQNELLRNIILNKLSSLYVITSPYIKKLDEGIKEDAYKASQYDVNKFYITEDVIELHKFIFPWEHND